MKDATGRLMESPLHMENGRCRNNIAKGIVQFESAIGLATPFPFNLASILSVTFEERTKIFHCCLDHRKKYPKEIANVLKSREWESEFTKSEAGGEPRTFYLSRDITDHFLYAVDSIIDRFGALERLVI